VIGRRAAWLVPVSLALLASGCGGSGTQDKATKQAEAELSGYVLDGNVKCEKSASPSSSAARYACHAGVVQDGVTQQVTIVVQCVDGADVCTRVIT